MKLSITLTLLAATLTVQSQELQPRNPWEPVKPELPEIIKRAKVLSRWIASPATPTEGRIIMEEIDPPSGFTSAPTPPVIHKTLGPWVQRPKIPAPELRLFSPNITVYPDNLSLIRWWNADAYTGYQEFTAWVRLDLSSIHSCGDLTVGPRLYCMMPSVHPASARFVSQEKIPSLSAFPDVTDILLTKGNPSNQDAMEPVMALLEKYDRTGPEILAVDAARKADQTARAAWEQAHPKKPQEGVIKHWVIRSGIPPKIPSPTPQVQSTSNEKQ